MPRLRLAEANCKGKGRSSRQVSSASASTTAGRASSGATNAASPSGISNEKATDKGLHSTKHSHDCLDDEFPDFAYDEFEFDEFNSSRKSSGVDRDAKNYSTDGAAPALTFDPDESISNHHDDFPRKNTKSTDKNSRSTSVRPIRSPTISSRTITVNDISMSKKKSSSNNAGYTKLFNSSLATNDENHDFWINSKIESNKRRGNTSNKKQKVSVSKRTKSSLDSTKKIGSVKNRGKNKSKPSHEDEMPQSILSDDDGLHDTDDEDVQSTAVKSKSSHESGNRHITPQTHIK
ncbi:hypothetical protein HJC23_007446 [Cyclotella cryptica]|uniref:Uncharacterized protein n=1 Tax=Cyclotella cryptica TaxID=29204 RepID=A0ABD3QHS1_9STRA